MNDVNQLLKKTLSETKKLREGENFLVRDLFISYEWNRIARGDRLLLGSMFFSYVSANPKYGVKAIEKGVSGQQRYQKTSLD